jgi:hypothetical protein
MQGISKMLPRWPPKQLIVNGGTAPTLGHLKRAIATGFNQFRPSPNVDMRGSNNSNCSVIKTVATASNNSDQTISVDLIAVYKYQPHTFTWLEMKSSGDLGTTGSSLAAKKKKSSALSNICQAPYFVKEGDQFCSFSWLDHKRPSSYSSPLNIAMPEDMCLRRIREREKVTRAQRKKNHFGIQEDGGSSVNASKTLRRQEVVLSLGRGFEFSDDDSDSNNESARR